LKQKNRLEKTKVRSSTIVNDTGTDTGTDIGTTVGRLWDDR